MAPTENLGLRRLSLPLDIVRELRIHQWVKNLLVFISPMAAHTLMEPEILQRSLLVFGAFCACASGIYVINDLMDLRADQAHPRKRHRPFASGRLPLGFGVLGPVLIVAGLVVSLQLNMLTATLVAIYVCLSFAYSAYLKTQPLVDVFTLSSLYALRVAAGAVAVGEGLSEWLLLFSGFMFLSLAFLKRVAEYKAMLDTSASYETRRGYMVEDVEIMKTMGVSASFVSTMILGLYLNSAVAESEYPSPIILWLTIPLMLIWQSRMWLSASRGYMSDDPIVYAARDWVSRLCFVTFLLIYGAASLVPRVWFVDAG